MDIQKVQQNDYKSVINSLISISISTLEEMFISLINESDKETF